MINPFKHQVGRRNNLIIFLGIKGSFDWAKKQMEKGFMVKCEWSAMAVKYDYNKNIVCYNYQRKEKPIKWIPLIDYKMGLEYFHRTSSWEILTEKDFDNYVFPEGYPLQHR